MRNIYLNFEDGEKIEKISYALSSSYRIKILKLLTKRSYSLQELAGILDLAISTISFHVKILKEANLVKALPAPSKKGNEKNISLNTEMLVFAFSTDQSSHNRTKFLEIPIGAFSAYNITPPCAICTKNEIVNPFDDSLIFDSTLRFESELLSFTKGWIEYSIVSDIIQSRQVNNLTFTLELCSECPNYNNNWKSDITFWINNIEIATYRSMGDYGGRRGKFTPQWWENTSTQYGMLVNISINQKGIFLNGKQINDITLNDLNLSSNKDLKFRIGIKDSAHYIGGINLFGKHFGDYNQAINLTIDYIDNLI